MKIKPQYLSAALVASALLLARLDTHAQTLPWQNYTDVPGRAFTAMLDPFSANAAEPSIFFGGPATDNGGCSIGLIGAPVALA